ncbi:N-acetyltransferase family protein [Anaeroselena agilis]|uniref:GNAT family N-acetyltransferase n=1 Tax=Anaeroselena agilis TaxID=3063788 RepID=A0ABU3NVF6_9FIRM|nr:GNAT family N-acetyltransferase [Selenomonadales bacterium 4137-cl]
MVTIRRAEDSDFGDIWPILKEVFSRGDTYSFSPDTSEREAFRIWMETPLATYVAVEDGRVMGTYFLKPNQPGLGAHVCNAGYAVGSAVRGRGIGRAMCEHSLSEARALGFKAMQFNFVVSTNKAAVELWQKCGFAIAGRLPKAFAHKDQGLVDALVMYRWLD